jgi:hypothetical protein
MWTDFMSRQTVIDVRAVQGALGHSRRVGLLTGKNDAHSPMPECRCDGMEEDVHRRSHVPHLGGSRHVHTRGIYLQV